MLTIPVGSYLTPTTVGQGGVAYDPVVAGTTTISASIPGFDAMTSANRTITVSAPTISLTPYTLGSGLQLSAYGYLNAANHGGVDVTLTSSAPGVVVLAPDDTTIGSSSLVLSVPDGQQYFYYYIQAVEGQTGTVTTTATANGFTDGTASVDVVQPAVSLVNVPTSIQAGADSVPFYAVIGYPYSSDQYLYQYQEVRAGGGLTVTLSSSNAAVGELVTSTQSGGSVTVQIPAGFYYSPTTVGAGGSAFKPLTSGTAVVQVAIPGFITTSIEGNRTVTVNP